MSRLLRGPLGALLATLVVLGALWPAVPVQPLSTFDQPFYLGIAFDLRHHGRFTDGYMFADPGRDGTRPPGMRFAPLYPALLAAASRIDPALRAGMDCQVVGRGKDPSCPRAAPAMRWLQFAMLAAFFVLVWGIGLLATARCRLAWTTLLLALPTAGVLLRSVDTLMTEITALLLVTACLAAVLAAWRQHSLPWLAAAGAALGLAILTRPAFLYLLYATTLAGLALAGVAAWTTRAAVRRSRRPDPAALPAALAVGRARPVRPAAARPARRALAALAVFVLSAAAVVAPWVARNALVVGHAALTRGYDSHTLVQRISFDSMTWREYGLSYLCWLPDGTGLGNALAGPHACDRFGWDERPDTFYSLGMGPLMQSTLAAAGGWDRHLGYLITHYILREPLWHAAVTIPLALRAMWIDHYWGLLLGTCCVLLTLHAGRGSWRRVRPDGPGARTSPADGTRHGPAGHDATGMTTPGYEALRPAMLRPGPAHPAPRPAHGPGSPQAALWPGDGPWQACFLLLVLPGWFMLAFNAAVAVNQTRYNLMLIPGFALAGALMLDPALRRLLARTASWHLPAPLQALALRPALRWLRPRGGTLSSAGPEAPRPPALPWRHPPLAARATGSARSSAAQRRRDPPAG